MATAGSAGTLAGIRTGTPGGCRSTRSSPHRPGQLPVPVPAAAPSRRADTAPRPSALTLTRAFLPFGFTFEAPSFLSGIIVGLAVRFSLPGKALLGICERLSRREGCRSPLVAGVRYGRSSVCIFPFHEDQAGGREGRSARCGACAAVPIRMPALAFRCLASAEGCGYAE